MGLETVGVGDEAVKEGNGLVAGRFEGEFDVRVFGVKIIEKEIVVAGIGETQEFSLSKYIYLYLRRPPK